VPYIRRDLFIVLLACLAVFFVGLGASGFIDPGDGYYTEGAREMIESGNYVVPHLNYQIYFSKPILIFWLIAGAYKVFGENEFAGRFWSALSATALALVVYVLTRKLANRRAALVAAGIFIASPLTITFARMALLDMVLTALLGFAVWAFINAVIFEKKHWWMLLYSSLALGFLTKGPMAPLLFLLSTAVYLLVTRPAISELKRFMSLLHPFMGAALFVLIIAPWCIAVSIATKGLFLKVFLWFENVNRFLGHVNHKHPEPWYYILVIIYGFFPWVVCLPAAINDALRRRLIETPEAKDMAAEELTTELKLRRNAVLFLACWSLCVLIFFSLAKSKVETYVLPCWFSFSVLTGIWLANASSKISRSFSLLSATCVISAVAALGVVGLLGVGVSHISSSAQVVSMAVNATNRLLLMVTPAQKLAVCISALVLCAGWVYQWFLLRSGKTAECLAVMVLSAVLVASLVTPAAAQIMYELKAADIDAVVIEGRGLNLAIFQEFKPSLMFYARQPIDSFFAPGQLVSVESAAAKESINRAGPQYVIVSDKSLPLLLSVHGNRFKPVYKKGTWGLYLVQGLTLVHLPSLERTFREDLNLSVGDYHWGTLPFAGGAD
jgi:4-amino-4-deoxy-L-arabinose transferase-like glycosyltransferase